MINQIHYIIFQLDWIVDYRPVWLGPAVATVGICVFVVSFLHYYTTDPLEVWILRTIFSIILVIPWIVSYQKLSFILIVLIGGWIEGVGGMKFYLTMWSYWNKLKNTLPDSGQDSTDNNLYNTIKSIINNIFKKISNKYKWFLVFQMLIFIGIIMSLFIVLILGTLGPVTIISITNDLVILWTLVTLISSVFGFLWKVWLVREDLPIIILIGLALTITGAELYNIRLIQEEILVFLLSRVTYTLAYIVTGALWLIKLDNNHRSKRW